jgi:putative serine protease PepD
MDTIVEHGAGPADTGQPLVATAVGRHRPPRWWRYALVTLAGGTLVVAGGGAGAALALHYDGHTTTVVSAPPVSPVAGTASASQLAQVAASVLPSVVTIMVTTSNGSGEGSGVIIRSDGMILTNNHVIEAAADGAGTIKVAFSSGKSADASILGRNPAVDLAVIRASGVSDLVPAAFGSVSGLHVGDTVLAIGSPLGLAGSVTSGIVSALHRTITVGNRSSQLYGGFPGQSSPAASVISNMIQTDTAINPGNSGGALVNDVGQVVGITTAIASTGGGYIGQQSGSIGVGFAIPADTASRIAAQLMAG